MHVLICGTVLIIGWRFKERTWIMPIPKTREPLYFLFPFFLVIKLNPYLLTWKIITTKLVEHNFTNSGWLLQHLDWKNIKNKYILQINYKIIIMTNFDWTIITNNVIMFHFFKIYKLFIKGMLDTFFTITHLLIFLVKLMIFNQNCRFVIWNFD